MVNTAWSPQHGHHSMVTTTWSARYVRKGHSELMKWNDCIGVQCSMVASCIQLLRHVNVIWMCALDVCFGCVLVMIVIEDLGHYLPSICSMA